MTPDSLSILKALVARQHDSIQQLQHQLDSLVAAVPPEPVTAEPAAALPAASSATVPLYLWLLLALLALAVVALVVALVRQRRQQPEPVIIREPSPVVEPKPAPVVEPAPAPVVASAPTPAPEVVPSLSNGQLLLAQLRVDASAANWTAEDVADLLEAYHQENAALVDSFTTDYTSITPNQKLFLILGDMGKTDSEIQRIMNITQTTIRSFRFRIKAKRR